jgi:hypothetical protein
MRAQLAAVVLLAACGEAPEVVRVDAHQPHDAAVDAVPPVDARVCPAPADLPPRPAANPPRAQTYRGRWACATDVGCPERPGQNLLDAKSVVVEAGGVLRWRNALDEEFLVVPTVASGDCWRVPRDEGSCTAGFDLCRGADNTTRAELERYDFDTATWYVWRWVGA